MADLQGAMVSTKATVTAHAHQLTVTNSTVGRVEDSVIATKARVLEGEHTLARARSQVNGLTRDIGEGARKFAALKLNVQRH